jgi:hypothetical protein
MKKKIQKKTKTNLKKRSLFNLNLSEFQQSVLKKKLRIPFK